MRTSRIAAILLACLAPTLATLAHGQSVPASPAEDLNKTQARQGWFWYLDPKKEEPKKTEEVPPPAPEEKKAPVAKEPIVVISSSKSEEEKCKEKATWSAKCGFVDPGDDFEFQATQRDILLQQMSLTPDNPDSVEAAQRYMKWVVGKASQAANMWYFNMVQKPDLDPTVKNPISEVGIALATKVNEASQYEYFKLIREEGGVLFMFSRNDCAYCHEQAPYTRRVARTMGLPLINVPLDGKCLPGFEGNACGNDVPLEKIAVLQVSTVPSLFLYVPSSTWIRLGTGMVSDTTILANTVNFFSAYRAAMIQGLDNSKGARPSVTFDPAYNAKPTGVVSEDGKNAPNALDRSRMLELMGYKTGQPKK